TATVTVTAGVSLSPASATKAPKDSQTFVPSGGSGTFTWSVTTNLSGASVTSGGVYTAGATGGVTDVLTATDSFGNTKTASITVSAGVSSPPSSASNAPKATQTFSASGGSGTGFTWSMQSSPSGGSVTSGGVYTAGSVGSVTDVVKVTDSLGNTQTANVTVGA